MSVLVVVLVFVCQLINIVSTLRPSVHRVVVVAAADDDDATPQLHVRYCIIIQLRANNIS